MITSLIIYIIGAFVYGVTYPIRSLSDVVISSDIATSIATASGAINSFSFILPISTIFAILGLVIAIEGFVFTYKAIMWIIKRLPTQS